MRYPASEKLEIIRLVEQSHLPVRRALEQIGIPRSTFYRWCDLYRTGGPEALDDCSPRPDRAWNRIPDDVRARIVTLALDESELSPRELAVRFTDAEASGFDQINVANRPRLLSDNGPSYVSTELAAWLDKQDMRHIRGAPYHPMTQGKIERWHLTLKNRILLENYYLPGELEARIEAFVAHYNHLRYHESIDNLTPADVYFGRGQTILLERERIKRKTIQHRRLHHKTHAA
jgi:transposase InsO family protein